MCAARYYSWMDASPLLARVLSGLRDRKLEAVLIGNAAAALHGAPVTTLDFDFLFRETATNLLKLKQVAKDCDAMILRPFYPVSKLYRMVNDDLGLQADFMPMIHGIRSFEGVRDRAVQRTIGGLPILVASLDDIIASKKAAGRERDLAVLPVLERTRRMIDTPPSSPDRKRRGSR
jgi:predicted nucleotidyltransferase